MRKQVLLYTISAVLLVLIIFFLFKTQRKIKGYAELHADQSALHNQYQTLFNSIYKTAFYQPDLLKPVDDETTRQLSVIDRATIIRQLDSLLKTAQDSANRRIVHQLDVLIKREIIGLLPGNANDSVTASKAGNHIAARQQIERLLTEGINRAVSLADYHKSQLDAQNTALIRWILLFIALSGFLLIVTAFSLLKERNLVKVRERELEIVLNRMSDSVISVDNNWRCTYLNDSAMRHLTGDRSSNIGKMIWEVQPGIQETSLWPRYQEAKRTQMEAQAEGFYQPANSWLSVKIYPSGNGLTLFCQDISKSKTTELQLTQTLKELTDYKIALDESSIVAITDQKGVIRHANENFCRISKYSRMELIGKDHRIINSGYHPKEFIRGLWTSIANGKIWKGEMKNRAKDGTIYWVDTTIIPFLDERGKPYQYVAIRADITERKNAEEKIIQSEKIYKTIASSIPGSVICLLDRDYRYLLIEGDMLEQLGYSKDQLLGNSASSDLLPSFSEPVKNEFERAFSGETIERESQVNGYDLMSRFIPLKDSDGSVYAIMIVALDITVLKNSQRQVHEVNRQLEEKIRQRTLELKKSNEELEAFSYSVSHDLRAPLRGIIGFTTILEEDYGHLFDAEGKRVTAVIKSNTAKMGQLIDDLLAFSRLSKKDMLKVNADMNAMIREVIGDVITPDRAEKITWKIEAVPSAYVDYNMIRQVWVNLISNAVKYSTSRQPPLIGIGSFMQGGETVYFVSDNGVGFNEDYKDKLFKVFQRLHNVEDFEGTGIGLALVEKIVSKHGGRVWAEGKEDAGARFYFSLPPV